MILRYILLFGMFLFTSLAVVQISNNESIINETPAGYEPPVAIETFKSSPDIFPSAFEYAQAFSVNKIDKPAAKKLVQFKTKKSKKKAIVKKKAFHNKNLAMVN